MADGAPLGGGFEIHELARAYPAADDWQATRAVAMRHPDSWVLLDGYHFDLDYQRLVKDSGFKLAVIDNTPRSRTTAPTCCSIRMSTPGI